MTTATIEHEVQQNGIAIVRTPTGIGVGSQMAPEDQLYNAVLTIEVEYDGRLVKREPFVPSFNPVWRDYIHGLDMLRCVVRVKFADVVVAELDRPDAPLPWMVLQGEQRHITEHYVSVPPALHITDERGDVFTLGFSSSPEAPRGEFAFDVLHNGKSTGVIASRIERRNGKVRAFTKSGWQVWNGRFWF
jgi:hypothetical protein